MTRTATLDSPLLLPSFSGVIVIADDAHGPYPRIGDIEHVGSQWVAWPTGAETKTPFRTRREAVAFCVANDRARA